ncbi:MAG: hypothetical protein OQL20_12335, partial [Sedimenticola sp.]|nr:hypothetical protein [Sedimenticola sp.]
MRFYAVVATASRYGMTGHAARGAAQGVTAISKLHRLDKNRTINLETRRAWKKKDSASCHQWIT